MGNINQLEVGRLFHEIRQRVIEKGPLGIEDLFETYQQSGLPLNLICFAIDRVTGVRYLEMIEFGVLVRDDPEFEIVREARPGKRHQRLLVSRTVPEKEKAILMTRPLGLNDGWVATSEPADRYNLEELT